MLQVGKILNVNEWHKVKKSKISPFCNRYVCFNFQKFVLKYSCPTTFSFATCFPHAISYQLDYSPHLILSNCIIFFGRIFCNKSKRHLFILWNMDLHSCSSSGYNFGNGIARTKDM